jgi:diguanylate cyclase (GGDEF)-like protein
MNSVASSFPPETILLVDDSTDNLRLLSTMLQTQGYRVKKSISGEFALQSLEVIEPDLILLDINMPGMDGYEVCKTLKKQKKYQSIPVIFISAADQLLNKVKAFQVGAIDYITKPFQLEEVLIRVENQLNQKRLYQKLQQQNALLKTEIDERLRIEKALTEANQKLELLASLDGLTEIANRRRFDEYIAAEWQRCLRGSFLLSLILIDVDFFHFYNEAYGHLRGDDCLKKVASILRNVSQRATDLPARYGGEEFVIVLPHTSQMGARTIAEEIQQAIAVQRISHKKSPVSRYLTTSIGVATTIPDHDEGMADFINLADQALFKAKKLGRDRIEFA